MSRTTLDLAANPVRKARRSRGRTIKKIAGEAGIHEQAWYLTECGCYQKIPPKILRYFSKHGVPIDITAYDDFRLRTQARFGENYFQPYIIPPASTSQPPLISFIEANGVDNITFFAKAACIQPSLLYRVTVGSAKQLPTQVRKALANFGLDPDDIYELNERTIEYYELCH